MKQAKVLNLFQKSQTQTLSRFNSCNPKTAWTSISPVVGLCNLDSELSLCGSDFRQHHAQVKKRGEVETPEKARSETYPLETLRRGGAYLSRATDEIGFAPYSSSIYHPGHRSTQIRR